MDFDRNIDRIWLKERKLSFKERVSNTENTISRNSRFSIRLSNFLLGSAFFRNSLTDTNLQILWHPHFALTAGYFFTNDTVTFPSLHSSFLITKHMKFIPVPVLYNPPTILTSSFGQACSSSLLHSEHSILKRHSITTSELWAQHFIHSTVVDCSHSLFPDYTIYFILAHTYQSVSTLCSLSSSSTEPVI